MRTVLRPQTFTSLHFARNGKKPVAFIGVGNMGVGMIQNIAKQRQVYAFDLNPKFMDNVKVKTNITAVKTIPELADKVDIFITMLPNHKNVSTVCEGDHGLFKLAKKNSLFLDCSTISPFSAVEISERASKYSQNFIDAPVSGGVGAAAAGTLAFMVGAPNEQLFEQSKEVLTPMAKAVMNCGRVGGGQIAKVCNNMALGIEMIAVSEALTLGKKLGLDPKLLTQIMKVSSSNCWSVDIYNPAPGVNPNVPASNNYNGGFACELMLKDLGIAKEAAEKVQHSTPLGQRTWEIYTKLTQEGMNRKDFSIVFQQLYDNKI